MSSPVTSIGWLLGFLERPTAEPWLPCLLLPEGPVASVSLEEEPRWG